MTEVAELKNHLKKEKKKLSVFSMQKLSEKNLLSQKFLFSDFCQRGKMEKKNT